MVQLYDCDFVFPDDVHPSSCKEVTGTSHGVCRSETLCWNDPGSSGGYKCSEGSIESRLPRDGRQQAIHRFEYYLFNLQETSEACRCILVRSRGYGGQSIHQ